MVKVKVEDCADGENPPDVRPGIMVKDEPLDLEVPSKSVCAEQVSIPSSSTTHIRAHFVGMGFSPTLVDRVIEENGDQDVELLLETLFTYNALQNSSPESSDSWDDVSSPCKDVNTPDIEFTRSSNCEIEEIDAPVMGDSDIRSSLLMMNFPVEKIDMAISQLGENASLNEIIDFIDGGHVTARPGGKQMCDSIHSNQGGDEETEALFGTMDKTLRLLEMGFSQEEISSAIDNFGTEAPIQELADCIFAKRIANTFAEENKDELVSESNNGLLDETELGSLRHHFTVKQETDSVASSSATVFNDSRENGRGKRIKIETMDDITASSRYYMPEVKTEPGIFSDPMPTYRGTGGGTNEKWRRLKMEDQSTSSLNRGVHQFLSKPPYFIYGNVVDISQDTWRKLSQFLYGIEPEYVNAQYFSAFIRKEGYFHNLPSENRFHILPKSPMTIEDAMPHTKRWWPSWDTRKQLSCISFETGGVSRMCERLEKMLIESRGMLSKEQQMDILHQCKTMNLIWVGQYKLSPIEPDQVEHILGYPVNHTRIGGLEVSERLKLLKYAFQTNTLGYLLSVLREMYPEGVKVLSIFNGIGGPAVALQRLGIHLKCFVSVEASDINRKILKRWWLETGQSGQLRQIEGIKGLSSHKLQSLLKEFGGFDLIVAGNPCASGSSALVNDRVSPVGVDLSLYYEFVRILQRVRTM
ncbi:DNA (cytosine-5)-methyltransferase DRM2 [Acorus calamus]|uniref:DNA (cytosine-5-)-methyltransferase n=1 Tax=Acorus calamus TaxID=4465 RepID=A0AAV9D0G5_ACOCL|nr:DNA (cytosine-5)-methyltransferase DRM2 [Acorus calamus]